MEAWIVKERVGRILNTLSDIRVRDDQLNQTNNGKKNSMYTIADCSGCNISTLSVITSEYGGPSWLRNDAKDRILPYTITELL